MKTITLNLRDEKVAELEDYAKAQGQTLAQLVEALLNDKFFPNEKSILSDVEPRPVE